MLLKKLSKDEKSIEIKHLKSLTNIELSNKSEKDLSVIFTNIATTSLNPNDGDLLRINLKLCYVNFDGKFSKIRKTVSFFQDPEREISEEESKYLDFSIKEKKNSKINWELVSNLFDEADLIISHNASFVKPWLSKYTGPKETLWGCSVENVDWNDIGFPSRNLETLSVFSGFFYDFGSSVEALDSLVFCLNYNKVVSSLLKNAQSPDLQLFAANAPIELKDLLKERKYRWNPDVKCWWLPLIDKSHGEKETNWLLENVPGTEPQIFEIDPKLRFER